jgi:uncharacterized protein YcbK (DUF882 family)
MLSAARRTVLLSTVARIGVASVLLLAANMSLQNAEAEGDTRTLTFHHLHTGEDITVTYMRDGRYDEAALKKLDWFMRDWRKSEETHIDPDLLDILWQVYREVGATKPIEVVCGYRSPKTNAMLRGRSKTSGVAESSQHTLGKAMDFFIPGVPLAKLREIGFRLQRGGVGFYPHSGSPFVHLDTGTIRAWPRMTYAQLEKLFPDGRTVHVSTDGRVLPRYAEALADVERRGDVPNGNSLAAARKQGAISAEQVRTAQLIARSPERPSLLARLFGGGRKTEPAADVTASIAPAAQPRMMLASTAAKPVAPEPIVPLPAVRPQVLAAVKTAPVPADAPYVLASDGDNMLVSHGLWQTGDKPHPKTLPFEIASADVTAGASEAMAYAAEAALPAERGPLPVAAVPADEPSAAPTEADMRPGPFARMVSGAQRLDSPWIRAAMLTPNVSENLIITRFSSPDPRGLHELFHKPTKALAMGFSEDPAGGMRSDRFTGEAIVFLATATFVRAQTASLN